MIGSISPHGVLLGSTYKWAMLNLNPLAYWRLGEPSGTNAADASGNGHTGTFAGTPILGAAGLLAGDTDTAVGMSAGNYLGAIDNTAFRLTSAFSVVAWLKTSSATEQFIIGSYQSGQAKGWDLRANPYPEMHLRGSSEIDYWAPAAVMPSMADGAIHMLAFVNGLSAISGYLDGTWRADTTGIWTPTVQTAQPVRIGMQDGGVCPLIGTVDEIAVFGRALSAGQIAMLYGTGKGTW